MRVMSGIRTKAASYEVSSCNAHMHTFDYSVLSIQWLPCALVLDFSVWTSTVFYYKIVLTCSLTETIDNALEFSHAQLTVHISFTATSFTGNIFI